LANAKFVQIAGEACDLLRGLREGPAFTAFESRKDVVRSSITGRPPGSAGEAVKV
jgi:hypothetical protein